MPDISKLKRSECTGCGACWNVCPKQVIEPEYDTEGFTYPRIGSDCIECGLCSRVCPILNGRTECVPDIEQYTFAAVSKDRKVCRESSSGGAFTEICRAYGDENTVIFGAKFDGLKVVHSCVIGVENIASFRKSKYVQSDIGRTLAQAKRYLEDGLKVVFSGTPCQIAGLKSYLGKDYENLLCIDFICHGVGSPKVFDASLRYLEKQYQKKITGYGFRNQVGLFGNIKDFVSCYMFVDGERVLNSNDTYQALFLMQLCIRESCGENCRFRNPNRVSDITLADFKGKLKIYPNMLDFRNYSSVVINTRKGDIVFGGLKRNMKILPCSLSDLEKYNPLFFRSTEENPDRKRFFEAFSHEDYGKVVSRFVPDMDKCELGTVEKIRGEIVPFALKRVVRIFLNTLKVR